MDGSKSDGTIASLVSDSTAKNALNNAAAAVAVDDEPEEELQRDLTATQLLALSSQEVQEQIAAAAAV